MKNFVTKYALSLSAALLCCSAFQVSAETPVIPEASVETSEKTENKETLSEAYDTAPATVSALDMNLRTTAQKKGYLILGGSFGLSFGDYTNVTIAPQVGYRFNQWIAAGGGVSYNYFHSRDWDYDLNYLGMHVYGKVYPIRYIVAFVQPEIQRRWGSVRGRPSDKEVFGCLLLGGGVIIPLGARGGMSLTVHYDVLQNDYTPYGSNIGYSVGYTFGF